VGVLVEPLGSTPRRPWDTSPQPDLDSMTSSVYWSRVFQNVGWKTSEAQPDKELQPDAPREEGRMLSLQATIFVLLLAIAVVVGVGIFVGVVVV